MPQWIFRATGSTLDLSIRPKQKATLESSAVTIDISKIITLICYKLYRKPICSKAFIWLLTTDPKDTYSHKRYGKSPSIQLVLCICDFDLCFFGITYPRNGTERKTKKRFMVIGMLACILTNCGPDGLWIQMCLHKNWLLYGIRYNTHSMRMLGKIFAVWHLNLLEIFDL